MTEQKAKWYYLNLLFAIFIGFQMLLFSCKHNFALEIELFLPKIKKTTNVLAGRFS